MNSNKPLKNKELAKVLNDRHKLILLCHPIFAPSYNKGDIIEIDKIVYTGDRTRVYPKGRKNNYEYVYNNEFIIHI